MFQEGTFGLERKHEDEAIVYEDGEVVGVVTAYEEEKVGAETDDEEDEGIVYEEDEEIALHVDVTWGYCCGYGLY